MYRAKKKIKEGKSPFFARYLFYYRAKKGDFPSLIFLSCSLFIVQGIPIFWNTQYFFFWRKMRSIVRGILFSHVFFIRRKIRIKKNCKRKETYRAMPIVQRERYLSCKGKDTCKNTSRAKKVFFARDARGTKLFLL